MLKAEIKYSKDCKVHTPAAIEEIEREISGDPDAILMELEHIIVMAYSATDYITKQRVLMLLIAASVAIKELLKELIGREDIFEEEYFQSQADIITGTAENIIELIEKASIQLNGKIPFAQGISDDQKLILEQIYAMMLQGGKIVEGGIMPREEFDEIVKESVKSTKEKLS